MNNPKGLLNAIGPVAIGIATMVWVVLIFRVLGAPDADYGGFISVAERLIAGDRLYADVYENKDPLFHYFSASSRMFTPLGSWFLSILYLILGSIAVWVVGKASGFISRTAFITAFIATPIVMTGASFFAGSSHIPAVVFILLSFAAAARKKWILAGCLVAVVCGLKLILFPMALVLILLVIATSDKKLRNLGFSLLGFTATMLFIYTVVLLRGEFGPYVNNLQMNLVYSQSATDAGQGLGAVRIHLGAVLNLNNQISLIAIVMVLCWSTACLGWRVLRVRGSLDAIEFKLFAGAIVSLLYGLVVIAVTGLWGHHALVFIVPACIGLVLLLKTSPRAIELGYSQSLPFVVVLAVLLAGLPSASGYVDDLLFTRAKISGLMEPGLQTRAILGTGTPTTYARVGNWRDQGHAFGLGEWSLTCPRFAQEIWESRVILRQTLECLPSANVILITKDVKDQEAYPEWNSFIGLVNDIVRSGYVCDVLDVGQVCRRVGT